MKKLFTFILAILCLASAWAADKTTSPFTGITVEDAVGRQDIFLYNVESGYWLQDNYRNWSFWTTSAQLASQGMLLGIAEVSEGSGTYYIKSPLNNAKMGWNGSGFYMDMSAGVAWTFTPKAGISNGYTIDDGTHYLHAAAENNQGSGGAKVGYQLAWDNAGLRNTWQIVTREERENYMKISASEDKPLDATYLVGMPNLPRNVSIQGSGWGISNWTVTRDGGSQELINNNLCDQNVWTFDNVTSLNVSQTVTGVLSGKYRARFYLMYSPTQIDNASEALYNDWATNGDQTVKAVAYVGNQEAKAVSYYAVDRATVQAAGEYYTNDFPLNKQLGTRYFAENANCVGRRMYVGDFKTNWIEFTVNNGTFDLGFKTIDDLDAASDIEFGGVELEYMGLESPYTGITPAEAAGRSDIFFYNVETGLWLQNNEDYWSKWTAYATGGTYGMQFRLAANGDGYIIYTPAFSTDTKTTNMGHSDLELNNESLSTWTFESSEEASSPNYCILRNSDGQHIGLNTYRGNYNLHPTAYYCANNAGYNVWQLVTREERIAYMEQNATKDNPIDATFLVTNPGFYCYNGGYGEAYTAGWTISRTGGNFETPHELYCQLSNSTWQSSSFSITQDIADIPNGEYGMTVQAFYRDGWNSDVTQMPRAKGTEELRAYYFIGSTEAKVMSIFDAEFTTAPTSSELGGYNGAWRGNETLGYIPDNANTFNRTFWFFPDKYVNAPISTIVTDNQTSIGLRKPTGGSADWLAFDNFRLYYYGPAVKEIALTNGYATFSAAEDYKVTTEGVSAYKATSKSGNYIILTEISDIPANTGVVLYGEGKSNAVLEPVASATSDVTGNMMKPNVTATVLPKESDGCKNYLLGLDRTDSSVCVFRPTSGNGTLKAGRAYLALPIESSGVKYFIGFEEDDATAIEETLSNSPLKGENIYNLAGQRLEKMQRGVNIVNGKKILK